MHVWICELARIRCRWLTKMPAPDDTFKTGDGAPSHEYSVHLMAQIVSNSAQQAEGRVVGDAGFKSGNWPFPHEAGENLPLVRNRPGLTVSSLSAEHTVFDVDNDALGEPLELGERVGFPGLSPFRHLSRGLRCRRLKPIFQR